MRAFLTLLVFLSAFGLQAQTVVQGRVSDAATGEALAFVHVLAAGEREGTTTDIDGRFRLAVRSCRWTCSSAMWAMRRPRSRSPTRSR